MSLDEVHILVVGENVWGRAATLEAALQLASNPKKYQVFLCHKDTRMDGMGYVSYPEGCVPREIFWKGTRGKPFIIFDNLGN